MIDILFMSHLCQSWLSKLLMEWYLVDWVVLEQGGTWWQYGTHKWYPIRKSLGITVRLILISPSYTEQFIVRLKLFSNGNSLLDWNSNSMFCVNQLLQKQSMWYELYLKKILYARGQFEIERMSPSKARRNVFEKMSTTKKDESNRKPTAFNCLPRLIFCYSGHLHNKHTWNENRWTLKRPNKKSPS